ncbi:MAG: RnfABCDGE type electron transport complex subunit D [Tissierellia bacterium]|nr:RnfABCDGE type electron transport complex subunit D [Tissierellia bacterium]
MVERLVVTSSPHTRSRFTVNRIMADVIIALIPATLMGIYIFGMRSAMIVAVSIISAMVSEALFQKIRKQDITLNDLSAVVTGLILALNVPPGAPLGMVAVGSAFAIIIVKQIFGGLGQNFMNPAMAARAFLVISYPTMMSIFCDPMITAVSSATPLAVSSCTPLGIMAAGDYANLPSLWETFIGTIPGTIGETSSIALIIGGIYLIVRKVISWEIPVIYIGTVFLLTFVLDGFNFYLSLYSIFSGGLMLGAFYMLTDYSSSPVTKKGKIVYAFGAGLLTTLIRLYGVYPEGVMFSVLLMNVATPMIEHFTSPKIFGGAKR